jgi:3-carboxy-cis,cis-muconate cycloisomerase
MSSRLIESLATTEELAAIFSDRSVLEALLGFEAALARAQARLALIPAAAAEAISSAAVSTNFDPGEIAREARKSASIAIPLVKNLTARVHETDPQSAGFVHWGATSQDAIDTAIVLLLRRAQSVLARDHSRLTESLRALSGRHARTVMLARTLLQPAPPITFGYKVAAWYSALQRSWTRVTESFREGLTLQFGGASGTLASYGPDGSKLARELAAEVDLPFSGAPWHTHRDRLAALVAHCAIYTGVLGKMARDISLLMQYEVGEVAEAGGGSSAMPNKQNPAGCAIALAAATRVPGLVSAFLAGMVAEHERAVGGWQAEWPALVSVIGSTGSALAAMADAIAGLTIYPDRMRANLAATHGTIFAEKANLLLAPKLGREASQRLLGDAAREAISTGRSLGTILQAKPEIAALLTPGQLADLDRPEDYLGACEEFRQRLLENDDATH